MMVAKREKKRIKQSFYRVLLSEVLPYELPVFINNKAFYLFADRLSLYIDESGQICGKKKSGKHGIWTESFLHLINGSKENKTSYRYNINKSKDDKRELVLIHPYMQLLMVMFYREYESIMTLFCSKSNFSIRYPYRKASFVKAKTYLVPKIMKGHDDYKCNEDPKYFFIYKKYSNINKFYESSDFHRLEKRFKYYATTDIKHCFDNIPIDKLAQATYNTKDPIGAEEHFSAKFSAYMRSVNGGKAKGIPIGPEYSRIFAELILQQIDVEVEKRLSDAGYRLHKHFECHRYVDDTFFFYDNKKVYSSYKRIYANVLYNWGMQINKNKQKKDIELPTVNEKTIAKRDFLQIVDSMFENKLETFMVFRHKDAEKIDGPFKIDSKYIIIDIKTILFKYKIELNEVSSGFLFHLQMRLSRSLDELDDLLMDYKRGKDNDTLDERGLKILKRYEKSTTSFFCELIHLLFFLFNNDMRMNTSIKILTILNIIVAFSNGRLFENSTSMEFGKETKMKIYKTICDELVFLLNNKEASQTNCLEISNLLLILKEIPGWHISDDIWKSYFYEMVKWDELNFMALLSVLYAINGSTRNNSVTTLIVDNLMSKMECKGWDVNDTECLYTMIALETLPFIHERYKDKIEANVENEFKEDLYRIRNLKPLFLENNSFKLSKACNNKFSAEVY